MHVVILIVNFEFIQLPVHPVNDSSFKKFIDQKLPRNLSFYLPFQFSC